MSPVVPSGVDEVYVLSQGELSALPLRPMRSGLFGKSLEDALQYILEQHPAVIPGSQIDPAGEDPPRFALLRREMPVGGWSLDHLYVDQFGVLTLVETKLLQNPESRRDVVGQIIEYAANAKSEWASGKARQYASEFWSKRGKDLDEVLQDVFPELDLVRFWDEVESNLEESRLRLIIAADSIRPEVRRMIEYLNTEMENAEVLGLELRVYGEEDGLVILAPRIVGQTQAIVDRRKGSSNAIIWNESKLRESFGQIDEESANRLIQLLDWSVQNDCFLESRAQLPSFGLAGKTGERIIGVPSTGKLYLFFELGKYSGGSAERDQFVNALKRLDLISPQIVPSEVTSGRNFSRSLSEMTEETFEGMLGILQSYCQTRVNQTRT